MIRLDVGGAAHLFRDEDLLSVCLTAARTAGSGSSTAPECSNCRSVEAARVAADDARARRKRALKERLRREADLGAGAFSRKRRPVSENMTDDWKVR